MAGGVMTTGQTNYPGRSSKRQKAARRVRRYGATGTDFARLVTGAAHSLPQKTNATGSLGAASPPTDG